MEKYNGEIIINRSSIIEPEIYTKRVKRPSGRKVFEKRIRKKYVDIQKLLESGDVKIENSSGAWQLVEGYGIMAIHL